MDYYKSRTFSQKKQDILKIGFLTYMYNAILELNLQHLILRDRTYEMYHKRLSEF